MPQGNLHAYAVDACSNLEKLATGLAQAGADPGTIDGVSKMADMCGKLVKALGKGQEQTGDYEPPAEPQPRPTLDSAIGDMHQQMQAQR